MATLTDSQTDSVAVLQNFSRTGTHTVSTSHSIPVPVHHRQLSLSIMLIYSASL